MFGRFCLRLRAGPGGEVGLLAFGGTGCWGGDWGETGAPAFAPEEGEEEEDLLACGISSHWSPRPWLSASNVSRNRVKGPAAMVRIAYRGAGAPAMGQRVRRAA